MTPADIPRARRLHHFAWRCRDAEETRHFYEDLLGLPLVHVITADKVPSTGEHSPYIHLFFRMADGSHIAFFDLGDGEAAAPSPNTPAWVNHFAMELETRDELLAMQARLQQAGIDVIGVTDHGFVQSIYFFDPNGLRLEYTIRTAGPEENAAQERQAHAALRRWTGREKAARV
jgi:catechol 2,3-dioxygenase-like lactoylglutathione lyase family enzyme